MLDFYRQKGSEGASAESNWNALFARYAAAYPELAADFGRRQRGELPAGWKDKLPTYSHTVRSYDLTIVRILNTHMLVGGEGSCYSQQI